MKVRYLWFLIFLISCGETKVLKTVNWKGNTITWEVLDGGATTSYLWKIMFSEKGESSKDLIFRSYSTPYVGDIEVHQDKLLILIPDFKNKVNDTIAINLRDVEEYIDEPVDYKRNALKNSNKYYKEPNFVKEDREYYIANDLL
ncbi:hypothetical protein AHMF7605_12190 [Adhaeribacter arboris]|uniref:Uncharacterized protein n=1 Tax=Adhaeribacter arboris TaxID=2072846 RepID=A0A2T2YFI6_9BACT|nr:hypothetical protein [Adhaeribacter arboris]PSR54228.1 hypothetical protein AHMF7605_12190 [Adhaeribacter arboris]